MSRSKLAVLATVISAGLAFAGNAGAATVDTGASVLFVHGIPGRDLGPTAAPNLPVDVSVNGICIFRNVSFDTVIGPLQFAAGTYTVVVSPSLEPQPGCSQPALLTQNVTLTNGENAALVAALGPSAAPALETIRYDLSSVAEGSARLVLINAAAAPALDLVDDDLADGGATTVISSVAPGSTRETNVPLGNSTLSAQAQGTPTVIGGPVDFIVHSHDVVLTFAIGEAANDSVVLVTRVIPDVL